MRARPIGWFADMSDPDDCWLWEGAKTADGYGRVKRYGRISMMAHRWVYQELVGPIPEGLTLDHLCRVHLCVNPRHLEPVTNRENVLRGVGLSAQNARKVSCKRGHLFTEANTLITASRGGARSCRTCRRERVQRWRSKYREVINARRRALAWEQRGGPCRQWSKLDKNDIPAIRHRASNGERYVSIASDYNVSPEAISMVVRRITWRSVEMGL